MQVFQTNTFKKAYKKLHENQLKAVNEAIRDSMKEPKLGILKKGDLNTVRVYKFKISTQLMLLAYSFEEHTLILTLLALGSHENFYRNPKNN
ncbi:MAG: type II toxin-antitoxin system RelE/ParE family toxin [Mailhella sp.]|nr:type II toxin-antitoxin system RelE/ParE family toxin [Mailhella sp.]